MKGAFNIFLLLAMSAGLVIAYIDSRPNWDDTGISFFLLLFSSSVCAFLYFRRPWLIALIVGIWIPLFNLMFTHNFFGSLLALISAFIGAYIGFFLKGIVSNS